MTETHVGVYRTVVKTTYLEHVGPTNYFTKDGGEEGKTYTEVFGPYRDKAQNQNYSMRYTNKKIPDGVEPEFDKWGRKNWRAGKPKYEYVPVATMITEKQELRPVLALNPNGSLSLDLDWVKYA